MNRLIPAPKMGDQNKFFSSDLIWENLDYNKKFLTTTGEYKVPNVEDMFLQGDGRWTGLPRSITREEEPAGIFVYLYDGNTLHFSNQKIEDHGEHTLTKSYSVSWTASYDDLFTAPPWYSYRKKIVKITSEPDFLAGSSIAYWFNEFTILTDISDLATWDVSQVKDMAYTFKYCEKLEDFEPLKYWDIRNVVRLWCTFEYCSAITNVDFLSRWNTQNVTNTNSMLYQCRNLQNIKGLINWRMNKVTTIGYMFYFCNNLVDMSPIQNWDVSSVTIMGSTFRNCSEVLSFSPLNGWDVSNVTSRTDIFYNTTGERPTWGIDW